MSEDMLTTVVVSVAICCIIGWTVLRRRDRELDLRLRRMELSRRYEQPGVPPTVHHPASAAGPNPADVKPGDRWGDGHGASIWDGEKWLPYR